MSILQIELPDEQLQILSEQARAAGHNSNGDYLLALWREKSDQHAYMIEQGLTPEQLEREEQLLLESLESEPEVVDDAWWNTLHEDVLAQVAATAKAKTDVGKTKAA